jgi:hypothetical protein
MIGCLGLAGQFMKIALEFVVPDGNVIVFLEIAEVALRFESEHQLVQN